MGKHFKRQFSHCWTSPVAIQNLHSWGDGVASHPALLGNHEVLRIQPWFPINKTFTPALFIFPRCFAPSKKDFKKWIQFLPTKPCLIVCPLKQNESIFSSICFWNKSSFCYPKVGKSSYETFHRPRWHVIKLSFFFIKVKILFGFLSISEKQVLICL